MTSPGAGAIIIWNDIAPEGRDDFYDWHLNEHMPERLASQDFCAAAGTSRNQQKRDLSF